MHMHPIEFEALSNLKYSSTAAEATTLNAAAVLTAPTDTGQNTAKEELQKLQLQTSSTQRFSWVLPYIPSYRKTACPIPGILPCADYDGYSSTSCLAWLILLHVANNSSSNINFDNCKVMLWSMKSGQYPDYVPGITSAKIRTFLPGFCPVTLVWYFSAVGLAIDGDLQSWWWARLLAKLS